jgi:hypothetical protein
MPLLSLILLAAWTMVLVRLAGARATLGDRTFLIYLLQGAFLGTVGMRLIQRLFDPYGLLTATPWIVLLIATAWQLSLLVPVRILLTNRLSRTTCVADAFLVAFAIGYGFDLCGALLAASSATQASVGLDLFPPWQFSNQAITFAGYGYWTGLVGLARSASLRFVRKPWLSRCIQTGVLLWVAIDAAVVTTTVESGSPQGLLQDLGYFTLHGQLAAWIAWVALLGLSFWEAAWVARAVPETAQNRYQVLDELRALGSALMKGRLGEYRRLTALFRLRRQVALGRAELSHAPGDTALAAAVRDLEERLHRTQATVDEPMQGKPPGLATGLFAKGFWRTASFWRGLSSALLIFLVFVLPRFPVGPSALAWNVLTFSFPFLPASLPIASVILAFILFRRYVFAAGKLTVGEDMDHVMQFRAEQTLLKMCLGMLVLLVLYTNLPSFYPLPNLVAAGVHAQLPAFNANQFSVLLLLFAVAVSGTTCERGLRWRRAPLSERRKAVLRQVSAAAMTFTTAWACLAIYPYGITALHLFEGVWLQSLLGGNGPNTALVISIQMMVLTGLVGVVLTKLWGSWSRRFEAFLLAEPARRKVHA